MNTASFVRLILLAAIWGGSFPFLRTAVPFLGASIVAGCRVVLAAVFLAIVAGFLHKSLHLKKYWNHYAILGMLNAALPFLLYAFAAKTVPASMLAILNATAPIWSAVIGAAWGCQRLAPVRIFGLSIGVAGVALLVGFDHVVAQPGAWTGICAALMAAVSYGIATVYTKTAQPVEPFSNAHGGMWAATVLLVPAVLFSPLPVVPTPGVAFAVISLGVVCTGIAFLLYFRLIQDIGATSALTVTFLIPAFGILWGALFLNEVIGWNTIAGSAIVMVGTALVTGFNPAALLSRKAA